MKRLIKIGLLCVLIAGYQTVAAQQDIAQQAYLILEQNCLSCHGPHGAFTEQIVIESAAGLIDSGAVVPSNPLQSELYTRLTHPDPTKRMPLGSQLSDDAIATISNWIQAGAPSWEIQHDVNFISTDAMLTTIQNHLNTLDAFNRPFARYFTTTHLYNAGNGPEALAAYQVALSKLVNSLSWGFQITNPQPIDPAETIFYIDLRDYEWDTRNAWTQIEAVYPYLIDFDAVTQAPLYSKLVLLRQEMNCEVPFVYADWFLATASLPPLYHDILALPETEHELERELRIDVARNLQSAPGVRVWRAGTNDSGVSNHNRVVERHTSPYGAYWKSHDFAGSAGAQNIFTHPLSFERDGGEVIFNLPNGLQAYYIADGFGNRIDVAPTEIVSNPAASDPAVRNGLSCIGCHTEGMKDFEDGVRSVIEQTVSPVYDKDHALRLYVENAVMGVLVAQDTSRYKAALESTGGVFGGIEPVHRFYEEFHGPIEASYAAAAVGLETEAFLSEIAEKSSLQRLGLTGLLTGGNVKRDAWTAQFSEVISALNSEDTPPPPPPPPPRPSFTGDLIPDPNLREAIAETLGKAPNEPITEVDLARLTRIDADERGITDLTGLEHATRLERIEFRHNAISDLSPLKDLTRLNNIKLRGNRITNVSPLANLTNVDWLGLEQNAITDLSPLRKLIKLNGIGIDGNPISDVSPLASLISLDRLNAWRTPISDFSVLARLPRLRWIEFGNDRLVSAIPTLKGLRALERLEIHGCSISDLSPLAELTQLEWLELVNNLISDVSPLAKLTNLKTLNLDANIISDPSSLAALTDLEVLYLENNVISDVSSLAGFKNLERLDLRNNAISDFSPLSALPDETFVRMEGNPGFPSGGPKITGPWLWAIVPGTRLEDNVDFLAFATDGGATEIKVATNGAKEGKAVGDSKWTLHRLSSSGGDNINRMTAALGWGSREEIYDHIVYGSVILDSPEEQQTTMLVGSDDAVKVWLNGEVVHQAFVGRGANDYQDFFPVTLKQGKNALLVALDNHGHGGFSGFFGFAPDAKYEVFQPGINFTFSTETTQVEVGDTFTVNLIVENIDNLAGWQTDIVFNSTVLRALSVAEGDFLEQGGGDTFFKSGTINNTTGKITGLQGVQLSKGEMDRYGVLVSVNFTAIANGESQLTVANFQAGSSRGEKIPATLSEITIVVGSGTPAAPVFFPEETALLANYPNPFNPETWIPYQLAESAEVTVHIYATNGVLVRTLALGHQAAGIYQGRSRAVYWDGRNEVGEPVASGIYFYTLSTESTRDSVTAGDFTATRKMLIRK
ncbi:hypothetical protein F4055_11390 [Candidatus Poribacteria bacterium]|nr:hypothetical protein [Candidatus Poribacteria bacterium]